MGIDLARTATVTASSSIDPYGPSRAVNGIITDPASRWLCGTLPGWIEFDLGAFYWVGQWSLVGMGGNAGWPTNYCMTAFSLQFSQTGNDPWTTVDNITGNTALTYTKTFTPVQARYWRVYVPGKGGLKANPDAASMMEVSLIEADPTPNTLTSLALKDGNGAAVVLTPAFAQTTTAYTASVPFSSATVTVTPTATDPSATIKVNNVLVPSGQTSAPINLTVGAATDIPVVVTPRVGDPKTYTVAATRLDSTRLTNLVVNDNLGNTLATNPAFDPGTLPYTVGVPYDSTAASVTLTPTREGVNATITVNGTVVPSGTASGPINVPAMGATTNIPVVVSSPGAATTNYSVALSKATSPYLKSVSMTSLRISFNKTQYAYNLTCGNTISSTTVTATAEDTAATIAIVLNGTSYLNGSLIPLAVGLNPITITVTSAVGGDTRTYVFNITRSS